MSAHTPRPPSPNPAAPGADQSQNIWLAGLGALARAQAEGSKAFDALVKQGMALQSQTQTLAKAQMAEAAQRMGEMTAGAAPVGAGRWNALEAIFEQRVARAIEHLGLPDAATVARLEARIDALEKALAAAPRASRKSAAKPAARG
ncbi:MAG: phasin family protein [Pseudomonadota bacterium]|nr:phasin family protein [Pseudomonadota bacterium]